MERINLLVLSEDLDLRIDVKNLVIDDKFAISGYSEFTPEGKTKIINKFPEVVLCAVRGDVPESVFAFVQDLLTAIRGTIVILVNDSISVELVNKAAQHGIRKVLPIDGIGPDAFSESIGIGVEEDASAQEDTDIPQTENPTEETPAPETPAEPAI